MKKSAQERFPDKTKPVSDFLTSIDTLAKVTTMVKGMDITQGFNKATINLLDETQPILVWALSDVHIGSQGVDYDMFKQSLRLAMQTDGVYILLLGDMVDAHAEHPALAREEIITPRDQYRILQGFIEYIADKHIASVSGNHENSMLELGFDPADVYHIYSKAPYFRNAGHLTLNIGKVTYTGVIAHKGKARSAANIHGENLKLLQDFNPNADFVASGDSHKAGISQFYKYDSDYYKKVTSLKTGTFKLLGDDYGRGLGFSDADPSKTCMMIFPNEKKIIPYMDLEDGIFMLNQLRKPILVKGVTK